MKLIIAFALSLAVWGAAMAQPSQPGQSAQSSKSGLESFYGLKLGEKYSETAVLNALVASGINYKEHPIVKDSLSSFRRLTYSVENIVLKGTEALDGVKASATVIMSPDNIFEALIIVPEGQKDSPLVFAADNALPDLMHFANSNVANVESEFFGLSLGSKVSLVAITKAVGDKGKYHSSSQEGSTRVHSFSGVTFGGGIWDYALFSVTPSGKLVAFTVYSIFTGPIRGYRPASRLYLELRDVYFKKYGFPMPSVEDDVLDEYVFSGQNGLDHVLSVFNTKTDSGKDAYCVQMEFVHDALNRELGHLANQTARP